MNRFFRYHLDHVLFWTLTIGFHAFTALSVLQVGGLTHYLSDIIVRNGLLAVLIYSNLLLIFPLFNNRKKVLTGIVLIIFSIAAYVTLKCTHEYLTLSLWAKDYASAKTFNAFRHGIFYNGSIALFYLGFATALQLSKQWYLQREMLRQIKLEKLNTELDYLKAQMNPHFLFNSINTIFFQINKENTEARETLGKFSDMLRYQLYECNGPSIAVEKELAYLKNYVDLQKLRRDRKDVIEFTVSDELKNLSLPPLLLIPFIENAFKHVSNHTDKPNTIKIVLRKQGEILELLVNNTTDESLQQEPGGIGLKNVQRRLELLYPDKHWLTLEKINDQFSVTLKFRIA